MTSLRDELVSGALSVELAPLITAGDDQAILDALTRKDIPVKGKVSAHDIRQYLMLNDLLLTIESSQTVSCLAAKRALEIFETFDLSNGLILAKFTQILTGLEHDNLIPEFTAQHKADLLAMGDRLVSRAEQIGLSVTITDIRAEIWNDDGSRRL